ncbi:hypothetical protein LNKW23_01710 [Paralimibaculum aggregatum]|uniref:Uncharacterized protein n=1 Tax=Paralimibaculum aggregatum TaxID=3036245 RepID=A0ABQ6LC45_9RHOB|nr:hypothetical protein LNKW23_01710 [Limibaculum sp. NKW23]
MFKSVVEPCLERVAVIEVLHTERHEGREFVISHLLRRNIFTDFDRRLSRHLAAVRGAGFPSVSVSARVRERNDRHGWQPCAPADHASVPHALAAIARRAVGETGSANLRLHYHGLGEQEREGQGLRRAIETEDVDILEAALEGCQQVGDFAFMEVTGDFDLIMVKPPEPSLQPIVMDLFNRRLTMPPVPGLTNEHASMPLFDFQRVVSENAAARTYMAALRHMLVAQKERAVLEFRAAAEQRILDFEHALRGRNLESFRLDAVISLVTRLKAGLGDSLAGLSEDAQITAFDWAEAIENGGFRAEPSRPEHEPLPWPGRVRPRGAAAGAAAF